MKNFYLLAALMIGCGGGVSDSKKLADLNADESQDLCEDFADDYPERVVSCSGTMITIGFDKAECAGNNEPAPATCTATVGDVRECFDELYSQTDAEICTSETLPPACALLDDC